MQVPVLIVHGTEDTLVPPEQAEELAAAAPGRATLVRLAGLGHNGPRPTGHAARVAAFLASSLEP
jgi:pimeloyl-ACP methyl ester carboxylesterase